MLEKLNLSKIQKEAAKQSSGPVLIVAGAGSGKTLTLTSHLFYLISSGVNPENIIAITFTNKAAEEMARRVAGYGEKTGLKISNDSLPFIGTFHSLGARILRKEAKKIGRRNDFTIFDDDDSLDTVKKILKELNLPKDSCSPYSVASKISQIKNGVCEEGELNSQSRYGKNIALVFEKYENALEKSNAFDFDDLIIKTVKVFKTSPETLLKYQNKWQHILIDEFQDVNTGQYEMVKMLANKHKNLFVIGDDAQSIYSFRGSDFRNFLNFENDWENAKIIKLEENYRSTKNIIKAASDLIKNNKMQKPKNLWTNNSEGKPIEISAYENSEEEAFGVVKKIMELIRAGEKLESIAVLYRTNAQSRAIEQALIFSQIPYEIFGGLKFYSRKEIKDIVAGLRYALNPKDSLSGERLEKTFNKTKAKILKEELEKVSGKLSPAELIGFFLENSEYADYLEKNYKNSDERLENVKELLNFAENFKNGAEFLEKVALMAGPDGRPKMQKNAVRLMTVHMAKGLEFSHIFLIGVTEKLLPHERSYFKPEDLEEERRLMYVAMTRAKQNLFLSFFDLPSRFLSELPPELIEFKKISPAGEKYSDWDDDTVYLE